MHRFIERAPSPSLEDMLEGGSDVRFRRQSGPNTDAGSRMQMTLLPSSRRPAKPSQKRDVLLVTHSDFADDIEIRPIGLENKEIAHGN